MLPSERCPLTGNCALPTRTDPSTALPLDTSRSVIVSRDSVLVDSKRFVLDFWKPTESGSYLHPTSNHPPQVIRGIPYSQFLRLRRISSSIPIFQKAAKRLRKELIKTGYDKNIVYTSYNRVLAMQPTTEKRTLPMKLTN